ncbi:MAG: rhodanese-like domain-containing protein [Acidimicrobiales bacterium]|nr:rhodanese-like domain-containing protein [Acidimicrobiales bacterium]
MTHREHPVADYEAVLAADAQLIDVREPHELARGTLPGAINIPLDSLAGRLGELDKNRRVVLLCRSGGRSGIAAELLTASGFTDVVNLTGGMLAVNRTT